MCVVCVCVSVCVVCVCVRVHTCVYLVLLVVFGCLLSMTAVSLPAGHTHIV